MKTRFCWLFLYVFMGMVIFIATSCELPEIESSFTPSPPTPTPSPVPTSFIDQSCPKVINTTVRELYDADRPGAFAVTITFDEPIEGSCIEDPENWEIKIGASGSQELTTENGDIQVFRVTVDEKKITIKAQNTGGNVPNGSYFWILHDCAISDESGNSCCNYSGCTRYTKPTCPVCTEGCLL